MFSSNRCLKRTGTSWRSWSKWSETLLLFEWFITVLAIPMTYYYAISLSVTVVFSHFRSSNQRELTCIPVRQFVCVSVNIFFLKNKLLDFSHSFHAIRVRNRKVTGLHFLGKFVFPQFLRGVSQNAEIKLLILFQNCYPSWQLYVQS